MSLDVENRNRESLNLISYPKQENAKLYCGATVSQLHLSLSLSLSELLLFFLS